MRGIWLAYGRFNEKGTNVQENIAFNLSADDFREIGKIAGFEVQVDVGGKDGGPLPEGDFMGEPGNLYDREVEAKVDTESLAKEILTVAVTKDPDALSDFVLENRGLIEQGALVDENVARAFELGLRIGVSQKNGNCANNLGAAYYMGSVVEQDYEKAAELYKLAMGWGCYQSIINLGYIYEYGRIGEPDYAEAYRYYSLAAALAPSSEAAYKLGDMFARGRFVEKDLKCALQLWRRSYDLGQDVVERAQPAIRIAQLIVGPDCEEAGIEPDMLQALMLFQQAEVGLRIDIDDGQVYYKKRLAEAIEGQRIARDMLDGARE